MIVKMTLPYSYPRVSMIHINPKATPTNNTNYSCHKAVRLV